MFGTETVGPSLVQKLKCGTMAALPPHPPPPPPPPPAPPPPPPPRPHCVYAPASFSSGFHLLKIITDVSEQTCQILLCHRVFQFL